MEKKQYESKKIYGKKYNKLNLNVSIDRELVIKLREKLSINNISIKKFLEDYIKKSLD